MGALLGVELARLGTWDLVTGKRTFTRPEFEDAIAASTDPEFGAPVIRPGHTDPRFDGEPALGRVQNLRMVGDRLVGDLVDLPGWLASRRGAAAYPKRSIEGYVNVTANSGRKYRLVITSLALLGATPPAMEGLADLPAAVAAGAHLVAASAQMGLTNPKEHPMPKSPGPRPVSAATLLGGEDGPDTDEDPGALAQAVDAILDEVQEALAAGDIATAVALLTGAESTIDSLLELLGLPDADDIPNGPPMTSASRRKDAPIVSANRTRNRKGVAGVDAVGLRKSLGLAEDASDEDVTARIAELSARPESKADDKADTEPKADDKADDTKVGAPAGTVLVDAVQWAEVQRQAAEGAVAAKRMRDDERNRFIGEVVAAGRLSRANTELRASLEREWDRDPETARKVAAGLAKVVHTDPTGVDDAPEGDDELDALYVGLFGKDA